MDEERLAHLLKKHLRIHAESRCAGHMAPTEDWIVVTFQGYVVSECKIGEEYYDENDGWKRRGP